LGIAATSKRKELLQITFLHTGIPNSVLENQCGKIKHMEKQGMSKLGT
jgi:hypothetical protein